MDDWEALGSALLAGKNGEALRALSESDEAKRLGAALPREAAEEALRSGDEEKMKALLQSILSTREGQALAKALSGLDAGK